MNLKRPSKCKKTAYGKLNQAGFSLVELIIAIAIMAIVSVSLTYFIRSVNGNYSRNQTEVDLQMESQTVMNQIKDLLVDTPLGVSVETVTEGTEEETDLYIYRETEFYRIGWLKSSHSLYIKAYGKTDTPEKIMDVDTADIMSSAVADFKVDISELKERHLVTFDILFQMEEGDIQTYEASNNVSLRNALEEVTNRTELYAKYEDTHKEIYPTSIEVPSDIYVWPGEEKQIGVSVKSSSGGIPNQSVTWIYGNDSALPDLVDNRSDKTKTYASQNVITVSASETGSGESGNGFVKPYTFHMYAKTITKVEEDGKWVNKALYSDKPVKVHIMKITGINIQDDNNPNVKSRDAVRGEIVELSSKLTGYNLEGEDLSRFGLPTYSLINPSTKKESKIATLEMGALSMNNYQKAVLTIADEFVAAEKIVLTASIVINGKTLTSNKITLSIKDLSQTGGTFHMDVVPSATNPNSGNWLRGETKTIQFTNIPKDLVKKFGFGEFINPAYKLVFVYQYNNQNGNEMTEKYVDTKLNQVNMFMFGAPVEFGGHKMTLSQDYPYYASNLTLKAQIIYEADGNKKVLATSNGVSLSIPYVGFSYKKNIKDDKWVSSVTMYATEKANKQTFFARIDSGYEQGVTPKLSTVSFMVKKPNSELYKTSMYSISMQIVNKTEQIYQIDFKPNVNGDFLKNKLPYTVSLQYQNMDPERDCKISFVNRNFTGDLSSDANGRIYSKKGGSTYSPLDYLESPYSLGLEKGYTKENPYIQYLSADSRFVVYYNTQAPLKDNYFCEKQILAYGKWELAVNDRNQQLIYCWHNTDHAWKTRSELK